MKYLIILSLSLASVGCEQALKFSGVTTKVNSATIDPDDDFNDFIPPSDELPPPVIEEPPVEPPPVVVQPPVAEPPPPVEPPPPPPVWTPGSKAEKLAQIQFLSCPISNKSDAQYGYDASDAPDRDTVFARIARCTAEAYPETPLASEAAETISTLLSPDDSLRHKFYDFLWYQPPYTDHFELYFGLDTVEARRIFCDGQDPLKVIDGPLYTTEYWQAQSQDRYWQWLWDPAAQKRWDTVQSYREQLRRCLQ